jgi:predicted Zn-dependent peptidase
MVLSHAIAAALIAFAPAAPTTAPAAVDAATPEVVTIEGDPLGVRSVVLDNGLTVLLSENHDRPEVFGAVVVRTGAKNDPPDDTGMAHYLEHMLFKGTTQLGTTDWEAERPLQQRLERLYDELREAKGAQRERVLAKIGATVKQSYRYTVPNELDQMLELLGGTGVNAFTTYDETVYHNTFPASQIDGWLEIYAHRFHNPVFRLFPTELEAVYEEKNIAIDTTGYELFRAFMRGAFPRHPYGTNDILGEVAHLKRPSLSAMRAYFDRYYVPGNMALVLSGDFSTDEVLPRIVELFGAWRSRPGSEPPARPVAPFGEDERLTVRLSPIRVGAIAFRTVPESHPDYAALQLARRLLSNEQRSGLIDRLSDDGKVLLAMVVPADFADHNLDVVAYAPRLLTQSFRAAEKLVVAQFRRVAEGRFDDRTFAALKEGLLAEERLMWEDNEERALAIAHAFVARGGWQGYVDYLRRLERIEREDVQRVASRLFAERKLIVRSRVGFPKKQRLEKPKHPTAAARPGAHSRLYRRLTERPSPPPKLDLVDFRRDVEQRQLAPGIVLRASENPFNDIYQLELRFGVGTHAIRELDLLEDWLPRIGSQSTRGVNFRRRLFELSTTLTATAELDRFVVRLQGPQRHMGAALELLDQLLDQPERARKPLRQLRREIWGYRHIERKDAVNVAEALREHVLYGRHSTYRREYGHAGALGVGVRRLRSVWARVQEHELEIRYVGRERADAVAVALERGLSLAKPHRDAVEHVVRDRDRAALTTLYFVPKRNAVQTQVWLAVEGGPIPRDRVPAADAFSEYFGGSMAGLVFQEVRELRALAYSAHGTFERDQEPTQRGVLQVYVGCQADKTFETLDVLLGLVARMPQRRERMTMVRGALVRSQETESPPFRELHDAIDGWRRSGYDDDPRRWLGPAYETLDFDDVARFYSDHVAGRPVAIMVVGDPRKVDRARLKQYGKLVRLREGKLYSK